MAHYDQDAVQALLEEQQKISPRKKRRRSSAEPQAQQATTPPWITYDVDKDNSKTRDYINRVNSESLAEEAQRRRERDARRFYSKMYQSLRPSYQELNPPMYRNTRLRRIGRNEFVTESFVDPAQVQLKLAGLRKDQMAKQAAMDAMNRFMQRESPQQNVD